MNLSQEPFEVGEDVDAYTDRVLGKGESVVLMLSMADAARVCGGLFLAYTAGVQGEENRRLKELEQDIINQMFQQHEAEKRRES